MTSEYDGFGGLYSEVTTQLSAFMDKAVADGEASANDKQWFVAIVAGFRAEFAAWPTSQNQHIRAYLALFRSASPLMRVAGHAFLHVAYDLPRVLAKHMHHAGTDRNDLRNLFLRPAPLFRQVVLDYLGQGKLGNTFRPIGKFRSLEILAYWLIALRSVAWIHAEIIADRGHLRAHYESNLAIALYKAGHHARSRLWVFGVPRLELSRLFQFAPVSFAIEGLTTLVVILGLVVFSLAWARSAGQSTRIGTLGQYILLETGKVFAMVRDRNGD